MKIKLIFFVSLLCSGIIFAQTEASKLGAEITLTEKTKISDILADPDAYLGETVLVEGEVLDVCPKMGCWMELKSDEGEGMIKIKVKDGDIVFPVEAVGDYAVVEGTVYKIDLTQEEAVNYFEHIAEESGKKFDPSTVSGPMTIYQIKGLGAEINQKEG
jgi:predicted RNA-binding protein